MTAISLRGAFRKLPVTIHAERFFRNVKPWPEGVEALYGVFGNDCFVTTLEGSMRVSEGDWIITGVSGERYPCKPDIFALTYEPDAQRTADPKAPLAEEIDRLRAALQSIVDSKSTNPTAWEIAKTTLAKGSSR